MVLAIVGELLRKANGGEKTALAHDKLLNKTDFQVAEPGRLAHVLCDSKNTILTITAHKKKMINAPLAKLGIKQRHKAGVIRRNEP